MASSSNSPPGNSPPGNPLAALARTRAPAPQQYDWVLGKDLYEAGIMSLNQIARKLGCSDSAVSAQATRNCWIRDPHARARVVAEREERLLKEERNRREELIIISAAMQSRLIAGHRKDIASARAVVSGLLLEVSKITTDQELFDNLGEFMSSPDDRGVDKLNKAYKRVISLPERAACLNTLATALKTLIMLERQAYNIEGRLEDPEVPKATEEVIQGLDKIMDKFNEVLAMQVPAPEPDLVIDVPRQEVPNGVPVPT